ncbi:MAG TPA: CoA protein activase [Clostridiaceae bacterium]|nr:CoA protein activase [Clostridiaceae bacterium]
MKVTFPHLGNLYVPIKAMLDDLGTDYVVPPFSNKSALELGTKYAPELACLPLKITIGNFIQAYEKGADTIIMVGGCGPCRFGYYYEMQREILHDIGYKMDMIALDIPWGNYKEKVAGIRKLAEGVKKLAGGWNINKILKAAVNTTIISKRMDELESLSFKVRPREKKRGTTNEIMKEFRNKVFSTKGSAGIKKLIEYTEKKLLEVEIDNNYKPLRVGIVGEIYTTIDTGTSLNIQERLGDMGVEVCRPVTISGWIIEHIIKGGLHLPRDLRFAEAAKPYLGAMIGGHAQETIGNSVLFAKDGYDGIIQIYPLTCMPEIVAESILPSIERDYGIPVLTLIIDEMTGEAGYLTRVEAFLDLLEKRRESKAIEGTTVLSGN